jgi:hypothetical protein
MPADPIPEPLMLASTRRATLIAQLILLPLTACLPYTVGTTAQTVPAGATTHSTSFYFIPNAVSFDDTIAAPLSGADYEYRHGLDVRSDIAVRFLAGGATVNYKRRLGQDTSHVRSAVAFLAGGGIVNGGEHFMFEGTLMASGREDVRISPYGGVRAMHVVPISSTAVRDKPTVGVFGGLSIGDRWFSVRPELGIYYDHSALGLRRSDLLLVPAITLARARRR